MTRPWRVEQIVGLPAEDCIYVSAKTGQSASRNSSPPSARSFPAAARADDHGPDPRPHLRRQIRRLPRRHHLRPRLRRRRRHVQRDGQRQRRRGGERRQGPRRPPRRRQDPHDGHRPHLPDHRARQEHAQARQRVQSHQPPASPASSSPPSAHSRMSASATPSRSKARHRPAKPLAGYKPPIQMVFCDFYPATTDPDDQRGQDQRLRSSSAKAMEKLSLNDSSFTFMPPSTPKPSASASAAASSASSTWTSSRSASNAKAASRVVQTAPTVSYQRHGPRLPRTASCRRQEPRKPASPASPPTVVAEGGQKIPGIDETVKPGHTLIEVHNPADLPDRLLRRRHPRAHRPRRHHSPASEYIGAVMKLCLDRRGLYKQPAAPSAKPAT